MQPDGLFLSAIPGLEAPVAEEARAAGFTVEDQVPGGVEVAGGWLEAMRANLVLRGPSRVLVRLASFRALHLAQLDKRLRKLDWGALLPTDRPVRVDAVTRKSRIYHDRAAAQRLSRALEDMLSVKTVSGADPAALSIKLRIDDDLATLSLDTSGAPLHRRGHKQAIGKAPLRETMAAMFLRQCGYDGTEPVVDPMCGSGTIPISAAEIALGLAPGRDRDFAFQALRNFDAATWAEMKAAPITAPGPSLRFHGSDRDDGAVRMASDNAARAGVGSVCLLSRAAISELTPPAGPPGLVMVNPPYGGRVGKRGPLHALYGTLGKVLMERFSSWRVGIVTSEPALARTTDLPFLADGPLVAHGGMKVRLYRTDTLS
ncbi:MAG: class I SAM-dependent RNA methyltransferase [Pseudomonadota bacterium]